MDWTGLGLKDQIFAWLEQAPDERHLREKRLDPFATSMRDFDDVTPNLQAIRDGQAPGVKDARQRISDLKAANLVGDGGNSLTELGNAALTAWEEYGVASAEKGDELARLLLLALEARRLGDAAYAEFYNYWGDLRTYFDPLELIDNWDTLYAINHLDYVRGDFAPGATLRDEKVSVSEIEFDLVEFAQHAGGSEKAIQGGERIEGAIGGKVPRGRHRATFCMALEIGISEGQSASALLERFGFPKKPRTWTPFNEAQKATLLGIIDDYGLGKTDKSKAEKVVASKSPAVEPPAAVLKPALPADIDFSKVLVEPPVLKATASSPSPSSSGKGSVPKKINYQQQSQTNDLVGKLGEDFAMEYERWRLRDHPGLLKKLHHVSKEDDSIGYDIESFELDGTPRLVEVKGTLGPMESRFFLTANELACAETNGNRYVVLRVAQLSQGPKCCEIRFPFKDKLALTPATYSATFKVA